MILRIGSVFLFGIWALGFFIVAFITAIIMAFLTLIRYIIKGDDGKNMDFYTSLVEWYLDIPSIWEDKF